MRSLTLCLLALTPLLAAHPALAAADKDTWKKYNNLIDDSDLYSGEGVAQASEYGSDAVKTAAAATQRARAALAASIQVRISSETSEAVKGNAQGVTETLETKSREATDLNLENVHVREFKDFPDAGKTTVIAYLGKEDYRRQLAGKGPRLYRPEFGLRLAYDYLLPDFISDFANWSHKQTDNPPAPTPGQSQSSGGGWNGMTVTGVLVEGFWRDWTLGLGYANWQFNSLLPLSSGSTQSVPGAFNGTAVMLQAGYDYTPKAWRIQPHFPLGLEADIFTNAMSQHGAADGKLVTGGYAGLGLRYWPFDAVALDLSWRRHQGVNTEAVDNISYDGTAAGRLQASTTGNDFQASVAWSGF